MKKIEMIGSCLIVLMLTACQSVPRQHNGATGYQIENKSENFATISYTLSARANQNIDEHKLQRTCQQVLGHTQQYKTTILSVNEIANPNYKTQETQQVQIGQSRTSFGLSNTQSLYSNEDYNTRLSLETKPSLLRVVRFNCTL